MTQNISLSSASALLSLLDFKAFNHFAVDVARKNNPDRRTKFVDPSGNAVISSLSILDFVRSPYEKTLREDPIGKSKIIELLHNYEIKSVMSPDINPEHKIQSILLQKNNKSTLDGRVFLIAFKGTNNTNNLGTDFLISNGNIPKTFDQALSFYQSSKLKFDITSEQLSLSGLLSGGDLALWVKTNTNDGEVVAINPRHPFIPTSPNKDFSQKDITVVLQHAQGTQDENIDTTTIPSNVKVLNLHSPRETLSAQSAQSPYEVNYTLQLYKVIAEKFNTNLQSISDLSNEFSLKTTIILLSDFEAPQGINILKSVRAHFQSLMINNPSKLNTQDQNLEEILKNHFVQFTQTPKNNNFLKDILSRTLSIISKEIFILNKKTPTQK